MSLTPHQRAQEAIDEFLSDEKHAAAVKKDESATADTAFTHAELKILNFYRKLNANLIEAKQAQQQQALQSQIAQLTSTVTASLKRAAPDFDAIAPTKRPTLDLPKPSTEWTLDGREQTSLKQQYSRLEELGPPMRTAELNNPTDDEIKAIQANATLQDQFPGLDRKLERLKAAITEGVSLVLTQARDLCLVSEAGGGSAGWNAVRALKGTPLLADKEEQSKWNSFKKEALRESQPSSRGNRRTLRGKGRGRYRHAYPAPYGQSEFSSTPPPRPPTSGAPLPPTPPPAGARFQPICYKCGQPGHLSTGCPNFPSS